MALVTRFAPSPTGYLHLGHALSALTGWQIARENGGRFLLRIEDIDPERCRSEYEAAIYEDMAWLGLDWEQPVRRQSENLQHYAAELARLQKSSTVYPCFCSRRDIAQAIEKSGTTIDGPDGPIYPGTCRHLAAAEVAKRIARKDPLNWRLDVARAHKLTGPLHWRDREAGMVTAVPERFGDVVLGRKDVPTSYHLSVVVDDHLQKIGLVTRGKDLFDATDVHRLLQALLDYETPDYLHHRLIIDPDTDWKLSKRDGSMSLRAMRAQGVTAGEIRNQLGF